LPDSEGGVHGLAPSSTVRERSKRSTDFVEFVDLKLTGSLCKKRPPYRLKIVERRDTVVWKPMTRTKTDLSRDLANRASNRSHHNPSQDRHGIASRHD